MLNVTSDAGSESECGICIQIFLFLIDLSLPYFIYLCLCFDFWWLHLPCLVSAGVFELKENRLMTFQTFHEKVMCLYWRLNPVLVYYPLIFTYFFRILNLMIFFSHQFFCIDLCGGTGHSNLSVNIILNQVP